MKIKVVTMRELMDDFNVPPKNVMKVFKSLPKNKKRRPTSGG